MTRRALFFVSAAAIALTMTGAAQVVTGGAPPPAPTGGAATPAPVDSNAVMPRFEVASVKRNTQTSPFISVGVSRGQFQASNVPIRVLINQAFQVQGSQIIGAPDWTQNDRYDIIGKIPEGLTMGPGVQQSMVKALLEDRFKLAAHKETRELPIYALVVARTDGRLGSSIAASKNDCTPGRGRGAARGGAPPNGPPPPPEFKPGARPPCGTMAGPGLLSSGGITMTRLAEMLSGNVGRIVVDRTGLTGNFEFDLTYTPDPGGPGGPLGGPPVPLPPGVQLPNIDPNGPSLFTALQEQLGLKLDATRGPVEVTVIDRIERPTED